MHKFPKDHVIILPHAENYRDVYNISLDEVVLTLNEPELHEGLSDDRYTVEKTIGKHRVYIYYYQTLPLQGKHVSTSKSMANPNFDHLNRVHKMAYGFKIVPFTL